MIFDDVLVPWERVFIDGDVESYNALMREGWAANIMQQTCIRAAVKLEFAYELCTRMARATNSEGRSEVAQMLGEILTFATLTRALRSAPPWPMRATGATARSSATTSRCARSGA